MSATILTLDAYICQFFTDNFDDDSFLTPKERAIVATAAPKRQRDFATGRLCAKKALQDFGLADAEILRAKGMDPIWPDGILGSISHAEGLCGAVVARATAVSAIGLDIEKVNGVRKEMWDMICTPAEQDLLNTMPPDEQAIFATLLFSVKESFYKLQYPATQYFLEFTDVELVWDGRDFRLSVIKPDYKSVFNFDDLQIKWVEFEGQIITVCYILSK